MRNKSSFFYVCVIFASTFLFLFTSCKKDNKNSGPSDVEMNDATQVAVHNEAAIQPFSGSFDILLEQTADLSSDVRRMAFGSELRPGGNSGALGQECYTTTITPQHVFQFPKTVVRDYGEGCLGADGKLRKGKIISVFNDFYVYSGASITTTFENFSVDSFALSGTMVTTNAFKTSPDTVYALKVTLKDAKATNTSSGFWYKINADLTFTQEKVTPNYYSPWAPFNTTGEVTGENSLGLSWKSVITKPVVRKITCQSPVSGAFTLEWNQNPDKATIDYGNGDCDNKATLTYKGFSKIISL